MKKRNICTFWDGAWDIASSQPPEFTENVAFSSPTRKKCGKNKEFVFYTTHTLYLCTCALYLSSVLFCFFLWGFRCLNITHITVIVR